MDTLNREQHPNSTWLDIKRSEVLSVRQGVEALALRNKLTAADGADILLRCDRLSSVYIREGGNPLAQDGPAVPALLRHIVQTGEIGIVEAGDDGSFSPDQYGWYRKALVMALRRLEPPFLVDDNLNPIQPANEQASERDELAARTEALQKELAEMKARCADYETDRLAGKSRSLMLMVIAALAKIHYTLGPAEARLQKLGTIRDALQREGVIISDDTLRSYLKEGLALLNPPQA